MFILLQLDAKKSPLALLVQTCSAIGQEPMNNNQKSFSQTPKPSEEYFRKTSTMCSPTTSNPSRVPTASPALSEGRADRLKEKSSNKPNFHNSSLQSLSEQAKYKDVPKLLPSHSPGISAFSERRKSHVSDNRKRKSFIHPETSERKIPKSDTAHSREKSLNLPNSPGNSYPTNRYNLPSTASEMPRLAAKAGSPSRQFMSMYDSYCLGCQAPQIGGNASLDPVKSIPLPFYPFGNPVNSYHIYAQMLMSASRNTGSPTESSPYVCNWVNPATGTCGKKFASADELSNHLRTHIATPNNTGLNHFANTLEKFAASPLAAAYLSHAAAIAAASPVSIPSSLLPRSQSPLNGYHSYKSSALSQFTDGLPLTPVHVGVSPYTSPYALYGSKMNPAAAGYCYP